MADRLICCLSHQGKIMHFESLNYYMWSSACVKKGDDNTV